MKLLNRCAVTVRPRQAFIDWAGRLEAEAPEDWHFEGGTYLLDEQDSEEVLLTEIHRMARQIMENELSAWTEDQDMWPSSFFIQQNEPQDACFFQDVFSMFFQLHISVAAFDLGRAELLRAELADIELF